MKIGKPERRVDIPEPTVPDTVPEKMPEPQPSKPVTPEPVPNK